MQKNSEMLQPLMQRTVLVCESGAIGARELANIAYGASLCNRGQLMVAMFVAVARVMERCIGDFNAQDAANTAWAFAMAGQSNAQLFATLAKVVEQRVGDFTAQNLANTAWAFATTC